MEDTLVELNSRDFLAFILVLQFIVYVLVLFDVPVARQIIAFVYFTTIPGFIFVKSARSKIPTKIDFDEGLIISRYLEEVFFHIDELKSREN